MGNTKFTLGLDFGTESGRALLVDVANGREVGSAVYFYADGVLDEGLPGTTVRLGPDWALQNPNDYIQTLRIAVPEALKQGGVHAHDVIGIGVDFTSCTVLPAKFDGTPLCCLDEYRSHPHAYVKLWNHHAAQPQADRITALARDRNESWLALYGGRVSSEWLHSKMLQIVEEAHEIYVAADRIVEAGDWLVWQMTGTLRRNACAAGYKALWQKETGYPSNEFLRCLDPRLDRMNETKLAGDIVPPGSLVGGLTEQAAKWMGLKPGTVVAASTIDAHAAVPGVGVTAPGGMVLILGTSTCHMILDRAKHLVPGISGVVQDGILPGLFGYEAGQAGVGDLFEWFVEHAVPAIYAERARQSGLSVFQVLEEEAARQLPGESGLLALDWWNGNRSVLVNAHLSGLLVGATVGTRPPDIFRALIEATAFGTQLIVETFAKHGVTVNELVACGGLAERNKLLLQIYADVTGREFKQAGTGHASALGAAMFGACAASSATGGYHSIADAAERMISTNVVTYKPDPLRHAIYQELFEQYQRLHDYFGRGENEVMRSLREIRRRVRGQTST